MTRSSLITSWFLSAITAVAAIESQQLNGTLWMLIAFIGFGICRYLRSGLPKITETSTHPFKSYPVFSVTYYFILLSVTIYILLNSPELITIIRIEYFYIFFLLLCFPLVPGFIKHEVYLYALTRKKPNKRL